MLLTWKTLPNRAEACKKKKQEVKSISITIYCLCVLKKHKKAKWKQRKVLETKGNGVICANKQRDGSKLFSNNSVYIEPLSNCTSRYNNIIGIKHSH